MHNATAEGDLAAPAVAVQQLSVLILGAGYVGASLAASCTKAGLQVTAFDRSDLALAVVRAEVGCDVVKR
ncbi:MAG: NAD-binding protein, partial [Micropruina sp.]